MFITWCKQNGGKVSTFFFIIYSWTLKLLMRTNEVVFQSVSMKYAHQNRFLLRIFPLCGINTSIYKAFLDLKPTDRHHWMLLKWYLYTFQDIFNQSEIYHHYNIIFFTRKFYILTNQPHLVKRPPIQHTYYNLCFQKYETVEIWNISDYWHALIYQHYTFSPTNSWVQKFASPIVFLNRKS